MAKNTISITSGSGYFGSVYTTTATTAGQWYADGVAIPGETNTTYTMTAANEGKAIDFRETSPSSTSNVIEMFVPSDISGLLFNFDAADETTLTIASTLVSEWRSKAGSMAGFKFNQATDANKPVWSATGRNSKPALLGDAARFMDGNSTALPTGTNPSTMAALAYVNAGVTGFRGLFSYGPSAGAGNRTIAKHSGDAVMHSGSSTADDNVTTIPWVNLDRIVVDMTQSTGNEIMVDGQLQDIKTIAYNTGVVAVTKLFIWSTGGSTQWNGSAQELAGWNKILSVPERQMFEGYLAHKWGKASALPSNHPYKHYAPEAELFYGNLSGYLPTAAGVSQSPVTFTGQLQGYLPTTVGVAKITYKFAGAPTGYLPTLSGSGTEVVRLSGALSGYLPTGSGAVTQKDKAQGALASFLPFIVGLTSSNIEGFGVMSGYLPTTSGAAKQTSKGQGALSGLLPTLFGLLSDQNKASGSLTNYMPSLSGESDQDNEITGSLSGFLPTVTGTLFFEIEDGFSGDWSGYLPTAAGELYFVVPLLIVEDGTVITDANSYVTLAYVNNYLMSQGYSDWAGISVTAREQAIIRATIGIDGRYGARYPGERVAARGQSLLWPRKNAEDIEGNEIAEDEIPIEIKKASAEAAYLEWLQPGYMNPNWTPDQLVTQETLGPLSVSYSDPSAYGRGGNIPKLTKIEDILYPIIGDVNAVALFGTLERI